MFLPLKSGLFMNYLGAGLNLIKDFLLLFKLLGVNQQ
jgi:hypothetical protein